MPVEFHCHPYCLGVESWLAWLCEARYRESQSKGRVRSALSREPIKRPSAKRVIVKANQKAECEARYRESQSKGRVRSALSIKRAFCTQRGALLWSLSISNRFQIDFKWDFNISVSINVMKRDWVLTHSQFLLWAARAPCLVRGGVCVEVCVCVCVCV